MDKPRRRISDVDKDRLKAIDIISVYERLGFSIPSGAGNRNSFNTQCIHYERHSHGDKNGSMNLDAHKNTFYCFGGCRNAKGEPLRGDPIDMVQEVQGCSFAEACEWLASSFGITLEGEVISPMISRYREVEVKHKKLDPIRFDNLSYVGDETKIKVWNDFFKACLPPDDKVKKWWEGRGFSPELLCKCDIRLVEGSVWRSMLETHNLLTLIASGLIRPKNCELEAFYVEGYVPQKEHFQPSFPSNYNVLFPFFNGSEDLIRAEKKEVMGFRVRNIGNLTRSNGKKMAKYYPPYNQMTDVYFRDSDGKAIRDENGKIKQPEWAKPLTSEGPVWSPVLFGFDDLWRWRLSDSRPNSIYLTESETSCIAMQEFFLMKGVEKYCVAIPSASNGTDSKIVREFIEFVAKTDRNTEVHIVADDDEAGKKFTESIKLAAAYAGLDCYLDQPHKERGLNDANDLLIEYKKARNNRGKNA